MAKHVKWQGNAADLPQQGRRVRYVGTGQEGNTYQRYEQSENLPGRTVTVADTLPASERKNTSNARPFLTRAVKSDEKVVVSPGGTFLGGFSIGSGKKIKEKTAAERALEAQVSAEGYKEYQRLATMDLDAQEAAVNAAKANMAKAAPKYNVHAFGGYDATPTSEETTYNRLLADLNKAKSIQYDIKGRQALDALTADQTDALARLGKASGTPAAAMATNRANEEAAEKAKTELLASGLTEEKIRELLNYQQNIPKREKNAKEYEEWKAAGETYAATNPVLATIASVGTNLVSGVGAIGSALERMVDPNTPVDYHGGAYLPYAYTSGVRDTVSQTLEADHGAGASFAYGVGTSMLDSAATVGLTALGVPAWAASSTLGGAAATAAVQEAKERGLDDDHAIWTGLLAGVAETAFEKISLENLITMKAPTGTARQKIAGAMKNAAIQAGIEGSEEVFTDFANLITDGMINGGLSKIRQEMDGYIAEGATESEARSKATGNWLKDTAIDFAAGALAGGIMGSAGNAIASETQYARLRDEYSGQVGELLAESQELLPDNEDAKKLRSKIQAKNKDGKRISGRDIDKLLQMNEEAPYTSDEAKIQSAVKDRLTELGEKGDTDLIAQAVTKRTLGKDVEADAAVALESSKYGQRVLNELNPENVKVDENGDPRDTYSSSWTGSIGTSAINPITYNRNTRVTGAKYNHETQKTDAIVKDAGGEIKTVPADQAKLTPIQEELFNWADGMKEAGPVLVGAYQPEQNLELYARSFKLAYEYGKAGVPTEYVEKSEGVNYLYPTQLKLAYEEGQKAAQSRLQAREEKISSSGTQTAAAKKKPSVSLRGATVGGKTYAPVDKKTMTRRQWASVEAMRAFSRATGVDVVFYQSQANEKGEYEGANGFYKDGTIYLDVNAGKNSTRDVETAVLKTAAHELTHSFQEKSPTQYEELKQFVVERLVQQEDMNFEDLVEDKRRRDPGLSYDEAVDELVADACEMMLKDSKAVEQLAKENRSLAQRIADWLRKWVRSIQAAMQDLKADRPESRAMLQYAQELQKLWDDALVAAARNNRRTETTSGGADAKESASVRDLGDGRKYVKADRQVLFGNDQESWSEQLEDYINGKIRRGQDVRLIAEDGDVLLLTRTSAGKLSDNHTSDGRTMSDAAFERKANAAAHIDELVEVSAQNGKPKKDHDGRHGEMAAGGWVYRNAYFMDFDGKYYKLTISAAKGAEGTVVYNIGQMKEEAFPKVKGSYAENGNGPRGNTSESSIRQSSENSQAENSGGTKFSLRDNSYMSAVERGDMDEAQKLVDEAAREAGYTYHLYHGTGAEFNVFDIKSNGGKHGTGEGYGIYLASSKQTAGAYGDRLIDAYVKFNRTAEGAKKTLSLAEVKRIIKTSCEADARRSVSDGEYDSLAEALKDTWVSNYVYTYDYTSMTGVYADVAKMLYTENENDGDIINEIMSVAGAHYSYGAASAFYRDVLTPATGIDGFHYTWGQGGDVYLAFDSEQIKSAETVTRDNSGKVIPLSERFNDAEPDIRFSKRDSEDKTKTGIKDQIKEHAEELADKPAVANVRVDSLNKMSIKEKRRWAEKVLQETGYKIDRQGFGTISFEPRHINQGLNYLKYDGEIAAFAALPRVLKRGEIIDRHENHKGRNFGTVTIAAPVIVNGVRGNMAVVVQMTGKNHYHTHRILMPDGSMFEFAQKNSTDSKPAGATLEKSAHATPMDSVPNGSVPQTEVKSQAENSGKIRNQQREPKLSDRSVLSLAAEMALRQKNPGWTLEDRNRLEIFSVKLWRVRDAEAELKALREEREVMLAGRKMAEVKGEERDELLKNKNRIDIAKGKVERLDSALYEIESKTVIKELLKKSRSIVEQEAAARARQEYREKRLESEQIAVTRRKIERNAKRLMERMTTNTDKKHIPEALKKPIGELLESLNFYSNSARKGGYVTKADRKYCEALEDLRNVLSNQRAYNEGGQADEQFSGYLDLPKGFEEKLSEHKKRVEDALKNRPLKTDIVKEMDLADLKDLDVILSVMTRSVTKMNEMFVNRRFAYVSDAAESSINAMRALGQHQDRKGEDFALWSNTLPWYAFQRFGAGGQAVFEGLQNGWDRLAFNTKVILDFREGLVSDAKARKWDTEVHTVELFDPDGEKVTARLTTTQLMSLHCLAKRKQALGHLLGGGIRPSAIELTEKKTDKLLKKNLKQDKQFKLREESLGQLLNLLTPEQVQVADAMQKFMTEQGSAWGNEVSMARFGYRAFTELNYFPIETDSQDRAAGAGNPKDGSLYRLQNISAVKPLTKNANNALILKGIFDVFADHTADMAKYNALVLPIIDAQKWYSYKYASKNEAEQVSTRTVQRAMTKAYGSGANNYVIKFLQDLNGVKETGDRGTDWPTKMISNYKRAMVAANMRVAVLQPTAYVRASAVIDYKYLAAAFADKTGTKQATAEMNQYSGIALWKSLGYFDTDVGRSIRDKVKGKSSKLENIVDKTMEPAGKGDEITWARLWRACKLEVQSTQKLTGEKLLEATAERFREVVYRTQVVDSTMTRSHMMRGSGAFTKIATSFMSEPTLSYNLVMESTRQIAEDAKALGMRVAIRKNWKTAGRAYQAYVVSAVVTAIVESLFDALRDTDDDKYLDKVWKAFGGEKPETVKDAILNVIFGLNGNLAGDLNPISKLPFMRDVVSIFGGYSNERTDTAAFSELEKAIAIWDEVIRLQNGDLDKATETTYYGNMTTYGMIYPTAKALSLLTGLPGSSAMRDTATAWNSTVGAAFPQLKARTYESKKVREAWDEYGKASGISYAAMARAADAMRAIEGDKDEDGNTISGSQKAKYVEYIRSLGLTRAQEKAVWKAAKVTSWSDKGTPWE